MGDLVNRGRRPQRAKRQERYSRGREGERWHGATRKTGTRGTIWGNGQQEVSGRGGGGNSPKGRYLGVGRTRLSQIGSVGGVSNLRNKRGFGGLGTEEKRQQGELYEKKGKKKPHRGGRSTCSKGGKKNNLLGNVEF